MFIVASVLTGIVSATVVATVKIVQKRERLRQIASETEHLNVIPNDVRKAAAMGAAEEFHFAGPSIAAETFESADSGAGFDTADE